MGEHTRYSKNNAAIAYLTNLETARHTQRHTDLEGGFRAIEDNELE